MLAEVKRTIEYIEYQWYWFDTENWIPLELADNESIEMEWQQELSGTRCGHLVFHCFGSGLTTGVNYKTMTTFCNSGHLDCPSGHNVFKIKRN